VLTLIFLAESTYRRVGQGTSTKANSNIRQYLNPINEHKIKSYEDRVKKTPYIWEKYRLCRIRSRIRAKLLVFNQNNTRDHPEIDLWEYRKNKHNSPHFVTPLCQHLYWLTDPLPLSIRWLLTAPLWYFLVAFGGDWHTHRPLSSSMPYIYF
jgi:hypothetical protein